MTGARKPSRELLAAVKDEHLPVRPLAAPWRRSGPVALWVAALGAAVLLAMGGRQDAALLGPALSWGASLAEVAVGLGVVVLALGKAIPGRGGAFTSLCGGAAAGVAVVAAVSAMTSFASRGTIVADPFLTKGPACFAVDALLGLSAFAVAAVLVRRARPLRAALPLTLAGLGTGLMVEGVYRLHCGISDLRHVGVWHGGAVAAVVLAGLMAGWWQERRTEREMEERLLRFR